MDGKIKNNFLNLLKDHFIVVKRIVINKINFYSNI